MDKRHIRYAFFMTTVVFVTTVYGLIFGYFALGAINKVALKVSSVAQTASAEASTEGTGWKRYSGFASGITFMYPKNFESTYIKPTPWPPVVRKLNKSFECSDGEFRVVEGRQLCVVETVEESPKSIHTKYLYSFQSGTGTILFSFGVRKDICEQYDQDEEIRCRQEIEKANPDLLMANIANTFTIKNPPRAL